MKLFDAHSHMHMGPRGLVVPPAVEQTPFRFGGAAIMSTQPLDYTKVDSIVSGLRDKGYSAVPCYGIHPWFLYDVLTSDDDEEVDWLDELKQRLIDHPDAIVGEIGLDGNRWIEVEQSDQTEESIWKRERILACPMELQRKAFEDQLLLAAELQRPVSIHVVSAWGELFAAFDSVRERMKRKYDQIEVGVMDGQKKRRKPKLLPPKIYFHAFSGKLGALPSIRSACAKGNIPIEDVCFGFPPAIKNFDAPKTPTIMKEVGICQLLLETDLEDATSAWDDLKRRVTGISEALDMAESEVARITHENAHRFYFE